MHDELTSAECLLGGAFDTGPVPAQGAYGILCEVESHPFATDAMLFMDWRDDHTAADPEMQESNRCGNFGALLSSQCHIYDLTVREAVHMHQ